MECPDCKHRMVEETEPMTFKLNPNVIVQKVKVNKCNNCGFSSVSENEYERVRKQLQGIKAPHKATVVLP